MRKKEIELIMKTGKTLSGVFLRIKKKKNDHGFVRFAVIVGKKVSKSAVVRNKKKRQVRDILRKLEKNKQFGSEDVIVLVLKPILNKTYAQVVDEICGLLKVSL